MINYTSRNLMLAYLLACTATFWGASCSPTANPGALEHNKNLVLETFAVLDAGALDQLDKYIAADYKRHSQATPGADMASLDDFKALLREWGNTYSGIKTKVDVLVAEGDIVAFSGSFSATQIGPMGPFPATGKHMVSEFAGYHRISKGKIAETWVTWDNLSALAQLGLFPPQDQGTTSSVNK